MSGPWRSRWVLRAGPAQRGQEMDRARQAGGCVGVEAGGAACRGCCSWRVQMSPLSQNSSITSLLHNPNRTVHFLKNKTKQIQSDFSKEPENMHFYVLYIRVVFFHINKYKFGGQKQTKKTKTMISRGITMNVLGICLNP